MTDDAVHTCVGHLEGVTTNTHLYSHGDYYYTHTYNELTVFLLQALVPFSKLVGHQLVLVSLLLTSVQLFR